MFQTPLIPQTPLQRQIAQMALDLAATLERQAQQAPRGGTLDACETLLLEQGRQFLRNCLAATLQQQIDHAEKKGATREPARADTPPAETRELPTASS